MKKLSSGLLALSLALSLGCDQEQASSVGPEEGKAGQEGVAAPADQKAVKGESASDRLSKAERLRYSFTDMAHLAVPSSQGALRVDLGHISSHKHVNGGWRAGWRAERKQSEGADYYEADSKSARVFFKHRKGGYDRVIVRMKAVKNENKVVFYVNDNAISNTKITGQWQDYEVKIPAEHTADGENQFMMRFTHDTNEGGRTQVAHVDSVTILPAGSALESAPGPLAAAEVALGGDKREGFALSKPQTLTWRLQVPTDGPKLALSLGAKAGGAQVKVAAASDTTPRKELLAKDAPAGAWAEEVVDLTAFAGQVIELDLEVAGDLASAQEVMIGEPGLFTPPIQDGAKIAGNGEAAQNVVIYLIDTLRYDKLGIYNPKSSVPTPNIDAFAKDATLYEAAYDPENWTKPSTATILTGLYPETHQAKTDEAKLPASAKMISEQLKENGFKTGSFIANGYVSDAFGFKKGWDFYTNYIREEKNTDAENLVKDSLAWIDQQKGQRFFAYIHTIDPHVPYGAPGEWKEKFFKGGKYDGPIKPQATGEQLADIKTGKLEINERDKRYLEALYDGEVAYNDSEFGNLIKGLKERGLYDNTLIVVLVDHGEEFWDHGSVGHGHSVYEELVHSPLILRYPGKIAAGRRLPQVVSVADVVPTVLDVLGVKPMEGIEGYSFADTFDGTGDPHPRAGVSDFLFRKKSIRVGRYHWITVGRHGELYDVEKDPQEKKNLINDHSIARAYTRSLFGVFMGAKNKASWWDPGAAERAVVKKHQVDNAEVGGDLQKQLEALGYVDGAGADLKADEDRKKMQEEDDK